MERSLIEWIKNEKLRENYDIKLYLGYIKSKEIFR